MHTHTHTYNSTHRNSEVSEINVKLQNSCKIYITQNNSKILLMCTHGVISESPNFLTTCSCISECPFWYPIRVISESPLFIFRVSKYLEFPEYYSKLTSILRTPIVYVWVCVLLYVCMCVCVYLCMCVGVWIIDTALQPVYHTHIPHIHTTTHTVHSNSR